MTGAAAVAADLIALDRQRGTDLRGPSGPEPGSPAITVLLPDDLTAALTAAGPQ